MKPRSGRAGTGARGIRHAFPIQAATIPDSLAGRDLLGRGQTGSGKTLAAFLWALHGLAAAPAEKGTRVLYISPLKALAVDIERNLGKPVEEIGLPISIETRTGDTPAHKRQRQKQKPPDILGTYVYLPIAGATA